MNDLYEELYCYWSEHIPLNAELRMSEDAAIVDSLFNEDCPRQFIENTCRQTPWSRHEDETNFSEDVITISYIKGIWVHLLGPPPFEYNLQTAP